MKIFISYRREDSADVTGRIYDRLVEKYGEQSIFKDVDSIPFGLDFREHLDNSVKACDVCLVIIGEKWLTVADKGGNRRIDQETDWVRIEVESALRREIPVIPLFVHNINSIPKDKLPDSLQKLIYRNGIPIRSDPDFHNDMNRLMKGIDELLETKGVRYEINLPGKSSQPNARTPSISKPIQAPQKEFAGQTKYNKSYILGFLIHLFTGFGLFYAAAETDRKWFFLINFITGVLIFTGGASGLYDGDLDTFMQYVFVLTCLLHAAGLIDTLVSIRKGKLKFRN